MCRLRQFKVLTTALYERFASRGEADYQDRLLSAMRFGVLGDAMAGDATLFARADYVEEAWRIVDPVLKADTPLHEYEPKTWGPSAVESVMPPGGWSNPVVTG